MTSLLAWMSVALARPVVALASVEADPCGFVRGAVEARASLAPRRVSVALDGQDWLTLRIPPGDRRVAFAGFAGRDQVDVTARWWFVETDYVRVRRPTVSPITVSGPTDAPRGEVGPLAIALDPRCDPARVVLTVTEGARPLRSGPPDGAFTAVPLDLPVGPHTLAVTLTADGLPLALAPWSVVVAPPCEDLDGDGHRSCRAGDCDDRDPAVHPGALELDRNGKDDDCDGLDGRDADHDGFVAVESGGTDCNDASAAIHPGALSLPDADGDGVPSIERVDFDCDGDADRYDGALDCADGDPRIPREEERAPTGVDEDCDGAVDEGTVAYDDDGDGFAERAGDCDDRDDQVFPEASERPDCRDNDCDGVVDEGAPRRPVDDPYERGSAEVTGAVRIVSRDGSDEEHLRVYAHDGLFDSFFVSVRAQRVGDGVQYWVRVTDPRGGVHEALVSGAGDGVWYGGKSGRDDTGTYEVEIVPATWAEGLEFCPLELSVSTG
ncbi:MAG: putative metal-binding motif-containing protein [Myxococcota bacterium]